MADFPSIAPSYKASGEPSRDPLLADFSKSGAFRGRRLQPARKRTFILGFKALPSADRATLMSHYDAHRSTTFNFTWMDGSGGPYVVAYADQEGIEWTKSGPALWDGVITLVEV